METNVTTTESLMDKALHALNFGAKHCDDFACMLRLIARCFGFTESELSEKYKAMNDNNIAAA